ncbi:transcriptional regulator [Erwinia sp. V90_4]|uniref:GNAT family N-acetyltransferase n=1 Tax=Erwinia sp. V90_4 TaxID=3044239 RepID=UPI00249DB015|nr:transcriptional regulator [Erwinia sp. V90_4]MDI3438259.1 transcriptional regulator [Erwinia sp. V90_4]
MFTTHLKLKYTGWEECTLSSYAQIYTAFGGSVCTHPRVLDYLAKREGSSIHYYMKKLHGQPIAGVFSINGSLEYKKSALPFVFDDIILPIKPGVKIILPFTTKRLSPYSQGIIFNSIRNNLFKKKMAHIKSAFSVKTAKKRTGDVRRFRKAGGKVEDVNSFSPAELSAIYQHLFDLRWQKSLKCTDTSILTETFTAFRDMIFGKVLFINDSPCAFDLNYKVECPSWYYFEAFNGGIDPQFKTMGVGSVLLWENIQHARAIAASSGKKFIFSLGAYIPGWHYKKQWCDIMPSGRTVF